jgi:hypothetical protein
MAQYQERVANYELDFSLSLAVNDWNTVFIENSRESIIWQTQNEMTRNTKMNLKWKIVKQNK